MKVLRAFSLSLFVVVSALFLFLTGTLTGLIVIKIKGNNKIDDIIPSVYDHQTVELNPITGEIVMGMETTFEDIGENNFQYYVNSNGNHFLVSNFGSKYEYVCSGSCYCDTSSQSGRRNQVLISTGLKYLLIAGSSVIAYKLAEEHFSEECEDEKFFADSCPIGSSVHAEVDSCEDPTETKSEEINEDNVYQKLQEEEIENWWCKGNCLAREESWAPFQEEGSVEMLKVQLGLNEQRYLELRKNDYYKRKEYCEGIKQEGEVKIIRRKLETPRQPEELYEEDVMEVVCVQQSKEKLIEQMNKMFEHGEQEEGQLEQSIKRMEDSPPEKWSTCVGKLGGMRNPSITCRKMPKVHVVENPEVSKVEK